MYVVYVYVYVYCSERRVRMRTTLRVCTQFLIFEELRLLCERLLLSEWSEGQAHAQNNKYFALYVYMCVDVSKNT